MVKSLAEIALNYKAGLTTAFSGVLVWITDSLSWFNSNLTHLAAVASFILVITMIIAHFTSMVRENRKQKEDSRLKGIEMEGEKLKNELLRIELKSKQHQSED
jgi:hypothetical protein